MEIVDDVLGKKDLKEFTLVDFGCGKSYLTFILYYYLTVKRGLKATVIGYDLKEDVVNYCNDIASRYGYDGLKFYVNDVTKGKLYEGNVDGVISLHACDVATDYALEFAVRKNIRYIFSVPCCQHEVNSSIEKGGRFRFIIKARTLSGTLFRSPDGRRARGNFKTMRLSGGRARICRFFPLSQKYHAPRGKDFFRERGFFRRRRADEKIFLPTDPLSARKRRSSEKIKEKRIEKYKIKAEMNIKKSFQTGGNMV